MQIRVGNPLLTVTAAKSWELSYWCCTDNLPLCTSHIPQISSFPSRAAEMHLVTHCHEQWDFVFVCACVFVCVVVGLLTSPERYILALSLHDNWGHCHGDWDGIKVRRVGCQGKDRCFCRQCPSPFHSHPMEPSRKPHDSHDYSQNDVHQSGKQDHPCVRSTFHFLQIKENTLNDIA